MRMVEAAARGREEADIDSDAGVDGPLSCLRKKVDPGRNKGRAAATWPVIANWSGRGGRGGGRGRGRGRVAARREAAKLSPPYVAQSTLVFPGLVVWVVGRSDAALFQCHLGSLARQGCRGAGVLGCSGSLSSRPAGPGSGADPRQSVSRRQGSANSNVTISYRLC